MTRLLNGETVDIPVFNFKTGKREYHDNFLTLKENDILVIEGIHGLNEKMSYTLPKESKYKIYISALTCLNVDEHNRIPTTDVRLLRRMVRDPNLQGTGHLSERAQCRRRGAHQPKPHLYRHNIHDAEPLHRPVAEPARCLVRKKKQAKTLGTSDRPYEGTRIWHSKGRF